MARAALKALAREPIPPDEIFGSLDEIATQNDQTEAVMGASFLDDSLKHAILARMRDSLSNDDISNLFDNDGPLATLSAKIQVAFALGIIGKEARASLHCIRDIRNAFAHAKRTLGFAHPAVAEACASLQPPKDLLIPADPDWPPKGPRVRFRATVRLLWILLVQASDRRQPEKYALR